jgi:hypothetical protein
MSDRYEITASPQLQTVPTGATVHYHLAVMGPYSFKHAKWYIFFDKRYDWQKDPNTEHYHYESPSKWIENHLEYEWKEVGKHTVVCRVTGDDGNDYVLEYEQWVGSVESVVGHAWKDLDGKDLPDPHKELAVLDRTIEVYVRGIVYAQTHGFRDPTQEVSETSSPVGDHHDELVQKHAWNQEVRAFNERFRSIKEYNHKLTELIKGPWWSQVPYGYWEFIPIKALFMDKDTGVTAALRVCVVIARGPLNNPRTPYPTDYYVTIVDWTNPLEKKYTRTFSSYDANAGVALQRALENWDSSSPYPPGVIKYEIPAAAVGKVVSDQFETGEKSLWDKISSFFDWAAAAAAITAVVLTLVNPVVGAEYAAVLISTAAASASAAAGIRIYRRRVTGDDNLGADIFDTLTIVSSVLGVSWIRGATVAVNEGKLGIKAGKYILLAQFTTDSAQGILIAIDSWDEYDRIMSDPNLTPDERAERLLKFFRNLGLAATMTYFNLKSTHEQLSVLTKAIEDLKIPNKVINLDEQIKVEGHTDEGSVHTTVDSTQARAKGYKPAKKPKDRGMRPRDSVAFRDVAKENDIIILVRNSNPDAVEYIGKEGYAAKPEELKAKSRKTPPNKGLAAADPKDQRLIDMLNKDKPPLSYDEFVKKLDKSGYGVASEQEGYVVYQKSTGTKYYSDYDLHGVYDAKTGKDAYNENLRKNLNKKFGDEIIQHGPHDDWPKRNKPEAGPNRGPQPPVTAYLPDGSAVNLESIEEMEQFYREHNIHWDIIYPKDSYKAPVGSVAQPKDKDKKEKVTQ